MKTLRVLAIAAPTLLGAASIATVSYAEAPPLKAHVTPDDIRDGKVRLAFTHAAFDVDGGQPRASLSNAAAEASLAIDDLRAPAVPRRRHDGDEEARPGTSVREPQRCKRATA